MIRSAVLLAVGTFCAGCGRAEPADDPTARNNVVPAARESLMGTTMEIRISIATDSGVVTADLGDNDATRALVQMLPVTLEMRDHLRQEKTGTLPSPLPELQRQTEFSAGTLGLWGERDFVVYYRNGRVPEPGIIELGRVTGDLEIFEGPEAVTVRIQRAD